jgi:hypothetical protein
VQLGANNSIVILSFKAQLPESFAADNALTSQLDQDTEKKQLSIYLRRETLVLGANRRLGIPMPAAAASGCASYSWSLAKIREPAKPPIQSTESPRWSQIENQKNICGNLCSSVDY